MSASDPSLDALSMERNRRDGACGCRAESMGPMALMDDSSCRYVRTTDLLNGRILVLQNVLGQMEIRMTALERLLRSDLMELRKNYDEAVILGLAPRRKWRPMGRLLARLSEWRSQISVVRKENGTFPAEHKAASAAELTHLRARITELEQTIRAASILHQSNIAHAEKKGVEK